MKRTIKCACRHHHAPERFEAFQRAYRESPDGPEADRHWEAWQRACRRAHPRQGAPWTLAEDRRLVRLVAGDLEVKPGSSALSAASKALGRSACGLKQRLATLRVARRHVEASSPKQG